MKYQLIAIYLSILLHDVKCIWPRPYKVDLAESKIFDLSEEISSDDEDDIFDPDDEMIKSQDLARLNIQNDDDKHYRIHQVVLRRNKKSDDETTKRIINNYRFNETNVYDYVESEPFVGEYVDGNGVRIESNLYKFDQVIKRMIKNNTDDINDDNEYNDINYDYSKYKAEYDSDEQTVIKSNNTYNYTDVKEEETVGEAFKTITDFKEPKNCTKEEMQGIGLNAAKCFLHDIQSKETPQQRKNLLRRIVKYLLVWIALYIVIAIPCWCQNGWCCCCCLCKICFPQERIDDVKMFVTNNPAGIYNVNGMRYEYKPSMFEKYAQKKLEKYIMKL